MDAGTLCWSEGPGQGGGSAAAEAMSGRDRDAVSAVAVRGGDVASAEVVAVRVGDATLAGVVAVRGGDAALAGAVAGRVGDTASAGAVAVPGGDAVLWIAPAGRAGGPTGLRVVEAAVDLARDINAALAGRRGRHADLADQLARATESVALNLAEGAGRSGRDKAYHYGVAYGSAGEAATAIRLFAAYGALGSGVTSGLLDRLDQVRAIAWRLSRPT